MKRLFILAVSTALAASSASAQTLLSDNFNAENAGAAMLNYNAFANWNVTGQVDLVNASNSIACAAPAGSCVDLDGSSGPGKLVGKNAFNYAAGDVMKITFDISGNQRGGAFDVFELGLNFGATTTIGSYFGIGGLSSFTGASLLSSSVAYQVAINADTPYSTWGYQFTALSAGTVRYSFATPSADNVGPILDNVLIQKVTTQSVVPEPSTWAMLAFGLSGLGVAARRRARG